MQVLYQNGAEMNVTRATSLARNQDFLSGHYRRRLCSLKTINQANSAPRETKRRRAGAFLVSIVNKDRTN